jgi:hypothetical protein
MQSMEIGQTKQGSSMAAQSAQVRHPANIGCILNKIN